MSDNRPKRDSMSLEEATVSNMWEIAAIVEILERKGLCTKQELYDIIEEIRARNPAALQGKVLALDSEDTARSRAPWLIACSN